MQGEFKGDFTRDTHHPLKRFSRVLMQQGRVMLDADWNEQTSIVLHYLRGLAADLIGPHGGPKGQFKIIESDDKKSFAISEGHYYVNGVLCENARRRDGKGQPMDSTYFNQPHFPFDAGTKTELPKGRFLAYLDVWERHVTFHADEDPRRDEPSIREPALGGPDTASRAQVVWQVRLADLEGIDATPEQLKKTFTDKEEDNSNSNRGGYGRFLNILGQKFIFMPVPGQLRAQARKPRTEGEDCACVTSPESRYRGVENQLYRVEIHKPGFLAGGKSEDDANRNPVATFKWSRENGAVVFGIRKLASGKGETTVTLSDLGRDARFGLKEGDWVEIVDDDYILQNRAEPLLQVGAINRDDCSVTLSGGRAPGSTVGEDPGKHPLLRRWDHKRGDPAKGGLTIDEGAALVREGALLTVKDGAVLVQEDSGDDSWLELENGIQIQFQGLPSDTRAAYKTGDYWLIPARVATGDVEWPGAASTPVSLPPHGVEHHYAPLAILEIDDKGTIIGTVTDLRRTFSSLAQ